MPAPSRAEPAPTGGAGCGTDSGQIPQGIWMGHRWVADSTGDLCGAQMGGRFHRRSGWGTDGWQIPQEIWVWHRWWADSTGDLDGAQMGGRFHKRSVWGTDGWQIPQEIWVWHRWWADSTGDLDEAKWWARPKTPVGAGSARDGGGTGDMYWAGDAAYAAATGFLTRWASHRHSANATSARPVNTCIITSVPKVEIT